MSEQVTHCHEHCHGNNIEKVEIMRNELPVEEQYYEISELFKAISDLTRVKILFTLLKGEMCVCDISDLLDMTQSAISHQLRILKQARLVKYRREGKTVFYSIADDHVGMILNMGIEHISE